MSDPFELQPQPQPRHWIEYATTIIALIVSVISLWVAIATEKANQKMVDANYRMVAAASWPFLQLSSGNHDDDGAHRISLTLDNAGVGPAKLQTFEVFWRGKAYGSSARLLKDCCMPPDMKELQSETRPVPGVVLRAGESRPFLRIDLKPENKAMWVAFDQVRQRELKYRACYCSVFDECWISGLTALNVRRVQACPKPAVPYYQ